MNSALWILQAILAVYFLITGISHFIVPPGLPAQMSWMYQLSPGLHIISGSAEILAAIGLILPGVTRIQPRLIVLAGAGLVVVMAAAAVWHLQRGEVTNIVMNLLLAVFAGFVAYGRWRILPIQERGSSAA
jgi:putative oxidoreductase